MNLVESVAGAMIARVGVGCVFGRHRDTIGWGT
jgi:hypothetical protein